MKRACLLWAAAACWFAVPFLLQAQQRWTLRQCIDYALEHNVDVQRTRVSVQQSQVEANTAKWARLPQVSAGAGQNWNWGRSASPVDNTYSDIHSGNTSFSLSASIPLFTGLQLPNEHALAKLNLKAALEDLNKVKDDLAVNVASAYLQVLFNEELAAVARQQADLTRQQAERLSRLEAVGKASPSETAEAEARLAQEEMNVVQAENNRRLALLELSQLLELPSPEGFALEVPAGQPDFAPLTPPDAIYVHALAFRPEIKAAKYRLEGSDKSIRIAQSAFYPQLSLSGGLGTSYYTVSGGTTLGFSDQMKNNFNRYVGLNLSIPLFNRLATRNRVRTARLQQNDLLLQLDNTKKALYKEIQQAWYNALAAESKYRSSEAAVRAGETSFRLMEEKFRNGQANFVEFTEAKVNLAKAQSDRLQAKYEYLFRTKILAFYEGKPIA